MRDYMPAKERKPIMIKEVEMSKNGITRALPSAITASVSDVSGLEYHAPTDSLLVLSDESKMILEVSSEWRVRDRLFPDGGVVRAQRRYTPTRRDCHG